MKSHICVVHSATYRCMLCEKEYQAIESAEACCVCVDCKKYPVMKTAIGQNSRVVTNAEHFLQTRCDLCHARHEFERANGHMRMAIQSRVNARQFYKRDMQSAKVALATARSGKTYWTKAIKDIQRKRKGTKKP